MSNKDQDEAVINPFTGKLDMVRIFNPNRILTHEKNEAGNQLMTYDAASGTQISSGPSVVVDNEGNVVVE